MGAPHSKQNAIFLLLTLFLHWLFQLPRSLPPGLRVVGRPVKQLRGNAPLDMMASESGARVVEELLVGIDEGYFA